MKLWRTDEPVLNDNKEVIKGGMFEHQRQWWESTNFIKALVTGYGSGKSFIGCKRSISLALHNAPRINSGEICPHLIVSPSYKLAKRTVIPTIKSLLSGKASLLSGFKWEEHKNDHAFSIYYKGRHGLIWIGSGDDPGSLKGPNIASALIDEPFVQDEEVLNQIIARVRHPFARQLEIGLTGTPEELNWGYDICEGEKKDNYDSFVLHASTRANLALSESYASTMEKAYTDLAAQAYVDGDFVLLTEGLVYYAFSDANIKQIDDPGGILEVGMDFNVDPMSAIVFWNRGNHMHVVEELELPNADTEYMCQYLVDTHTPSGGDCRIKTVYPDATGKNRSANSPGGKSSFWYIEHAGFEIDAPVGNPNIRDRENAVNGKFKPRDQSEPTLTIDPSCKKLISYFKKYQHAKKHKQKAMSHLIDAIGYPVNRLFPIVKPDVKLIKYHGA